MTLSPRLCGASDAENAVHFPVVGTQDLPIDVPESNGEDVKIDCMPKESQLTRFTK